MREHGCQHFLFNNTAYPKHWYSKLYRVTQIHRTVTLFVDFHRLLSSTLYDERSRGNFYGVRLFYLYVAADRFLHVAFF